ncbi:MAG: formate dehydrogenase accessory sulfurtransferase FdhD [Actinomycetota bacterium]|nr:formate dehydrogenase accessory sulfurtransferase FdhD [Actinomycetota bacterium]
MRRHAQRTVADTRADTLAGEEPLEIRIGGRPFTVTMRTPGNDFELAAGFLLGEGMVGGADDIAEIGYGPGVDEQGLATYNIVDVTLADGVAAPDPAAARQVYTSSSCGICGTSSIDAVTKRSRHPVADDPLTVPLESLLALPDLLRSGQELFRRTGGVHAAGLFTVGDDGLPALQCLREDVGRHNAVDKVIGQALLAGRIPLRGSVLQVSGRASFELVQKASMAGVPMLSAVSAPSSLAVELAAEVGLTLAGFSRGESVNIYSRADRVSY